MKVKVQCKYCHKYFYLDLTEDQYKQLTEDSKPISDRFPEYIPGQDEVLISQTCCDECWKIHAESD